MAVLFETRRLVVRRADGADADALMRLFGDAENVRYYGDGRPWGRSQVLGLIASYPFGDLRLASAPGLALLKPDRRVVGFGGVGCYVWPGNTADLLFLIAREYQGRGLATELASSAVAVARRHPEVEVVNATAHSDNRASIRVLEKIGMRPEGYDAEADRLRFTCARTGGGESV